MIGPEKAIFWFRRDLRIQDNAGLYQALKAKVPVLPIFIFDTEILNKLPSKIDKRVSFLYQEVERLKNELEQLGSSLVVKMGKPKEVLQELLSSENITAIYCNRDYEPSAIERDKSCYELCQKKNVSFHAYKDQVIFDRKEVVKNDGSPYLVFTPYMRKWKEKCNSFYLREYPTSKYFQYLASISSQPIPSLKEIGFEETGFSVPSREINLDVINNYHNSRDIPAQDGTSKLSVHLRFGTLSIRELMSIAADQNEKFWNELIWREFYMMILYHFPHSVNEAIKPAYDSIHWENNEQHFEAWCKGKTGVPLVDAGMRELNETGYMHNRVRMVVASFLTKNLLMDWRWGEAYFAEKLLDYEQSSNVGGWQWAAGCGCDAAPYFRIFNPISQQEKFDPDFKYVQKWVPEFRKASYPQSIVDLKSSRTRALERYKAALQNK